MREVFSVAKRAAGLIIRMLCRGDWFAVAGYSNDAWLIYPTDGEGGLVPVDAGYAVTKTAYEAIAGQRTYDMANMGDGILLANDIFGGCTMKSRAYIILCDKYANTGTRPDLAVWSDIPVIIAGLNLKNESDFNRMLSKNEGSRLMNAADMEDAYAMAASACAAACGADVLLIRTRRYADGSDYFEESFQVDADKAVYQIVVVWFDWKHHFSKGVPGGDEVNVILIGPDGKDSGQLPDIEEDGYCIFHMSGLAMGLWHVLVQYTAKGLAGMMAVLRHKRHSQTA